MLQIYNARKQFSNGFTAIEDVNLEIKAGEIISFIGTSGCGKSTLLRILAGLDRPTSGQVLIDDQLLTAPRSEIGIIFQEPRLMPWLTVRQNVQFGLEAVARSQKEQLTQMVLERVGLAEFADALPRQLSGGMAQRVAIARALVPTPSILLLDEPFSALDSFNRMKLQDHLLKIWHYTQPTMVLVTHDVEEALVLSDRIVIMRGNPGRIHQIVTPALSRPRIRTEPAFQRWKEQLLTALDISIEESSQPVGATLRSF